DLEHAKAAQGRACRVGAVCRVGDQHLRPVFLARVMERGDHAEGRPLTMSACRGLEGDALDADDLAQRLLETPHQLERTLYGAIVLVGVEGGEAWKRCRGFVGNGVVLHGAAAE